MKAIILNPLFLPVILAICLIYVTLIFHFASQKKIGLFLGQIFTTFLVCIISKLTIFPFNKFDPSLMASSTFKMFSVTGIIVIGFFAISFILLHIYFQGYLKNTVSIFKDPFLGILLTFSVFSTFWSYETEPTFRNTILIFFLSSLAAHIARKYTLDKISLFLRIAYTFICFMSLFYALFKPAIGLHQKGWKGIAIHPNFLGIFMAFNILLWTINALNKPKYPWLSWGIIIISFYVMQMANSAGSFMTAIIMLAMLVLLNFLKGLSSQQAFTAIVLFLVIGVIITLLVIENWVELLSSLNKDPTLTGRTDFWPQLIDAINQKPILGYGYHNFWQPWRGIDNPAANIETTTGFKPPHAHNGFIELGLDLGYVGLILFIISFFRNLALGATLLTKSKNIQSCFPTIFLGFLLLQNITESRLFAINFVWFYYVMFTVKLNHQ